MPPRCVLPPGGRPVTISGLGCYLPPTVMSNDDIAKTLETTDEWIKQRTGIAARRIVDPSESSLHLGVRAARAAIADSGVPPEDIGLVIAGCATQDRPMPANAPLIAYETGCTNAGAYDICNACSSFLYGLLSATAMITAGVYENVIVLGAEAISRLLDWQDRSTAILFGDGAGAAVVSASKGRGRILGFDLGADGSGGDFLQIPGGGTRVHGSCESFEAGLHFVKMNGQEVYKFATRIPVESATRLLHSCGRTIDDVDLLVPHQANLRIIEASAKRLGIDPAKVFTNVQKYANTSAASVPICLTEARDEGRIKEGDLVLMMAFGGGLTWGSCLMEWGP
jgi:3-oxoacyl-[acyl-carrier-protein] synthase III